MTMTLQSLYNQKDYCYVLFVFLAFACILTSFFQNKNNISYTYFDMMLTTCIEIIFVLCCVFILIILSTNHSHATFWLSIVFSLFLLAFTILNSVYLAKHEPYPFQFAAFIDYIPVPESPSHTAFCATHKLSDYQSGSVRDKNMISSINLYCNNHSSLSSGNMSSGNIESDNMSSGNMSGDESNNDAAGTLSCPVGRCQCRDCSD